jgi:hypothetical protein
MEDNVANIEQFNSVDLPEHQWVTVVNPTNRRMLLQACDNCGVVKSENTVVQKCREPHGQALISSSLFRDMRLTA